MSFRRALGPFDATMMVVGGIIGAGIFLTPSIVAQQLPSGPLVLGAWAAGGLVAMAGAFAYAELGSLLPRVGGQYAYLREAFHPLAGFLYGWALLLIIETGAMAAVAITFAEYLLRLVGRPGVAPAPVAIAAIVLLSAVNYVGVKPGSRLLNLFVVLKVIALALLIVGGLLLPAGRASALAAPVAQTGAGPILVAFGAALVPILFSYGGWQQTNYVAEEIANPRRNLPRSLVAGTTIVVLIYVAINVAYLRALGHAGLAATTTPAADAASRLLGPMADRFVAAAIAISTFGFLDLAVLAATRVYYAMAADGLLPGLLARLHPRYRTPGVAIVVQSIWACVLLVSGTYGELLNYVVFADWIFFGLTVAGLFVFRRRLSLGVRGPDVYVSPGYPVLPAFFVLVSAAVVGSAVWAAPQSSLAGAALLALGLPVYAYRSRQDRRGSRP
jgi:APA family basic amino acid/polyamine antiporter